MNKIIAPLLLSLGLSSGAAHADRLTSDAVLGGALGGALGAYVGAEMDGRSLPKAKPP